MYTIYIYDIGSFGGPENEFYVRVSCQIYNDLSDIEYLSNAIQYLRLYMVVVVIWRDWCVYLIYKY